MIKFTTKTHIRQKYETTTSKGSLEESIECLLRNGAESDALGTNGLYCPMVYQISTDGISD